MKARPHTRRSTRQCEDHAEAVNILRRQLWAIRRCLECKRWFIGIRGVTNCTENTWCKALFCTAECEGTYWRSRLKSKLNG